MEASPRFSDLSPALRFLILLSNLNLQLNNASLPTRKKGGLTGRQIQVLAAIRAYPEMAVIDLANYLRLHPSTVSGVLERLRRDNYLSISTDREDARRKVPRLTARGRRVVGETDVESALRRALEQVPTASVGTLGDCLQLLVREIEATGT